MLPLTQQSWQHEAAHNKGYTRGLAASEPSRMITVNVNVSALPCPDTSTTSNARTDTGKDPTDIPRRITFSRRQDTSISSLLAEIHQRLPQLEDSQQPFTIATSGPSPCELGLETRDCEVMELLQPWDATFLNLRVDARVTREQGREGEAKKSLGERLKRVVGVAADRIGGMQVAQAGVSGGLSTKDESEPSNVRSVPPAYEEFARSKP